MSHKNRIECDGVTVTLFRGDDGMVVVEVVTPRDRHINPDETPRVRVWMNDHLQYDGLPIEEGGEGDQPG